MCGILGVFGRTVASGPLASAIGTMADRGPDGHNLLALAPDKVLGHTRLAIIDLDPRAAQPMTGLGGRLAIAFNGEIYNAPDLRRQIPDYPWRTDHSDTEAILAAYWRWGEDFVGHLRGMFALALYDAADDKLLLAVDRFSIKPLCLHVADGALTFASTATAIAATGIALAPNLAAVHSFLADGVLEIGEETFFAGIDRLPAATLAVWTAGRLSTRPYWQPPQDGSRTVGDDEIVGWLEESLDSHMLADVPVGLCLSSGIDSNVLRLLSKRRGQPLHSFTFCFPGTVYDEAARVAPVLAGEDGLTTTVITPDDLWRDMGEMTRRIEMPLGGVATYGHFRNAATARAAGYKVLLAGEGADEIFGGYKYYAETAIGHAWRDGRHAEAQAMFAAFAARDPGEWRAGPEALAARFAGAGALEQRAPDGTSLAEGFLDPAFATTVKLAPVPAIPGEPVRAAMWRDLAHAKLPKLLRWQDRCYMASGVEVRVPFLDHVLVERLAEVPVSMLLADGMTKSPLRRLAASMLPSDFFSQPKLYVATPQREWLKRDLASQVERMLDPGALLIRHGLVDLDRLRARYHQWMAEPALGNSFFIWKFIAMERFFQAFFGD